MNAPEGRIRRKPIPPRQPPAGDGRNNHETAVEPLLGEREYRPDDVVAHPEAPSAGGMAATETGSTATSQYESEYPGKTPPSGGSESIRSQRRELAKRVLKGWWQELICCVLSITFLRALVFFLRAFDGEPLPNWPTGITIDTVVAFLATISRTALVIPVAKGLSQAKWNWFKKKPRPLEGFDVFDQASRGPWGSVPLLFRTKGWLIGVFSAVLFVTSIATPTLTQSVVSYPSRNVSIAEEGRARAWKMGHYHAWATNPIAEDVSDLLESDSAKFEYGTNLTLPNGVNTTISADYKTVTVSHGTSLVYNDTQYHDASVFNYFAIQADSFDEHPRDTEMVLHWCINTYDTSVINKVVSLQRVLSHTEAHYEPSKELRFGKTANVTYFTSPADEAGAASHTAEGMNRTETIRMLQSVMSGTTTYGQRNKFKNGSDVLMHAYISTLKPYEDRFQREKLSDAEKSVYKHKAWWEAVEGMAQKLTNGITNSLLPSTSNVNGTAWQREVYVEIRWPWLTLLAAQVLLSALLLALVIMETVGADVDIVKSSTLAALFAIGAEEKTALEKDVAEGKPLLSDEQDDRPLVMPAGIGGELRKEAGGKWLLGGSNYT